MQENKPQARKPAKLARINRTNRFDAMLYAELVEIARMENRTISNLLETAAFEYMRRRKTGT